MEFIINEDVEILKKTDWIPRKIMFNKTSTLAFEKVVDVFKCDLSISLFINIFNNTYRDDTRLLFRIQPLEKRAFAHILTSADYQGPSPFPVIALDYVALLGLVEKNRFIAVPKRMSHLELLESSKNPLLEKLDLYNDTEFSIIRFNEPFKTTLCKFEVNDYFAVKTIVKNPKFISDAFIASTNFNEENLKINIYRKIDSKTASILMDLIAKNKEIDTFMLLEKIFS